MKKFLSKYSFWILQVLGCAAFALIATLFFNFYAGVNGKLILFLGVFLSYLIPTTALRYLYKRIIDVSRFTLKDLLKIILILIVVIFFGNELSYYLAYFLGILSNFFGVVVEAQSDIKRPENWRFLKYLGPFLVYTGWTFFYFILKELRRYIASGITRSALKDEIKQAQLNTLKGHLNPNFMVASLKMIKELMLTDVPLARNLLTKLSETLRYSLTKNNINSVLLEDELQNAQNYVALLNITDSDKYEIVYTIDPKTLECEVPPILVMSLMEMATKNGMLLHKEGGKAILASKLVESNLEITVTHSGNTRKSKATESLENKIRQRLRLLFEGKAQFSTVHDQNNTILSVKMPMPES